MNSKTFRSQIESVRRFNRFYTRQIGLLKEGLLQSPFSLTEVRILYELANRKKATAVELCKELGTDAGYLSRMVRAFEKARLVHRTLSKLDARQNLLTLTNKGMRVFAQLNRRQNQEVAARLKPLSIDRREKLTRALGTVEQAIAPATSKTSSPYLLRQHQPGDMGWVVHRHGALYFQEYGYDERFEALVAQIVADFIKNYDPKRERCWMAERDGEIAGSVFLVKKSRRTAKLRLLLVEPSARGLGIGKRLVDECVRFAQQAGYKEIVLWTQSELPAARGIYKAAGFRLIKKQRHRDWGRTNLVAEIWKLKLEKRVLTSAT